MIRETLNEPLSKEYVHLQYAATEVVFESANEASGYTSRDEGIFLTRSRGNMPDRQIGSPAARRRAGGASEDSNRRWVDSRKDEYRGSRQGRASANQIFVGAAASPNEHRENAKM